MNLGPSAEPVLRLDGAALGLARSQSRSRESILTLLLFCERRSTNAHVLYSRSVLHVVVVVE